MLRVIDENNIPASLDVSVSIKSANEMSLDLEDLAFIYRIFKRFFFNFYFLQKIIIKISIISNDILFTKIKDLL